MMRGRKSKCGNFALGALLAVMAGLALWAPAAVQAAPSNCEYCAGDIPTGDGGGEDPTANTSGGGSSDQPDDDAAVTTPEDTSTTTEPVTDGSDDSDDSESTAAGGGKGDSGGGGGDGKEGANSGTGARGDTIASTPTENLTPTASSDSDSGGGISPLLIVIAIVTAICVGLAIWRLRRVNVGRSPAEINPGA